MTEIQVMGVRGRAKTIKKKETRRKSITLMRDSLAKRL